MFSGFAPELDTHTAQQTNIRLLDMKVKTSFKTRRKGWKTNYTQMECKSQIQSVSPDTQDCAPMVRCRSAPPQRRRKNFFFWLRKQVFSFFGPRIDQIWLFLFFSWPSPSTIVYWFKFLTPDRTFSRRIRSVESSWHSTRFARLTFIAAAAVIASSLSPGSGGGGHLGHLWSSAEQSNSSQADCLLFRAHEWTPPAAVRSDKHELNDLKAHTNRIVTIG